jgi:hypothetical protein
MRPEQSLHRKARNFFVLRATTTIVGVGKLVGICVCARIGLSTGGPPGGCLYAARNHGPTSPALIKFSHMQSAHSAVYDHFSKFGVGTALYREVHQHHKAHRKA